MQRRALFKKAMGVIGVGTAWPLITTLHAQSQLRQNPYPYASGVGSTPAPPPLDRRTPEQILDDANTRWRDEIFWEIDGEWNKSYKQCYRRLPPDVIELVETQLVTTHRTFETRIIAGHECLIINGNVIVKR
jgi:hypothetical protein